MPWATGNLFVSFLRAQFNSITFQTKWFCAGNCCIGHNSRGQSVETTNSRPEACYWEAFDIIADRNECDCHRSCANLFLVTRIFLTWTSIPFFLGLQVWCVWMMICFTGRTSHNNCKNVVLGRNLSLISWNFKEYHTWSVILEFYLLRPSMATQRYYSLLLEFIGVYFT